MQRHAIFSALTLGASLAVSLLVPTVLASALAQPPAAADDAEPPAATLPKGRPAIPQDTAVWAEQIAMNYPVEALRYELQGRVGVRVKIGPDGLVSECFVTASSGHQILDETACLSMQRYARFKPALDSNGDPTDGSYSTSINYSLSRPEPAEPTAPSEPTEAAPV